MTTGGKMEHRAFMEVRATAARTLSGYVSVYNTEARIGDFVETIAPGAFADALRNNSDILALVDHDVTKVLGRTKSGTLRLTEDAKGLAFTLSLPDTQAGRDIEALAARSDIGGCSMGFLVRKDGETWSGNKRTLTKIDLREVSIIQAHPAYDGTEVFLRSLQQTYDLAARRRRALIMAEITK